jgi:hypothetical protein
MSLADSLTNMPPAGDKPALSTTRGSSQVSVEDRAPKLVPASQKRRGEAARIMKVAVIGPAGTGKTYTILSLIKHLGTVEHLNPEEIRIEMIDLDGGLDELTDQSIIPDEYLDRLFVAVCSDFPEVVAATKAAYHRLEEHKKVYGIRGAWIVVDNMEKAWNLVQNDYCLAVYGMSLVDKMEIARKSQVQNKKLGSKGEGVFDKNLDWGVIKPMHADWTKSFETCGFNFLWLSPWKMQEVKNKDSIVIEAHEKFGSDENSQKVSHIIKKEFDTSGKRRASFVKSRDGERLPKNLLDTTWTGMFCELDRYTADERTKQKANLESTTFGRQKDYESDKDEVVKGIMGAATERSIKQHEIEQQRVKASEEDYDW